MTASDLAARFVRHVRASGVLEAGDPVVAGVSGGVDSVVLLHLLRFSDACPGCVIVAAHLDHAMRPGSAADADWVVGLARSWGVRSVTRRLDPPAVDEAEARGLRYAYLEEVRAEVSARVVLTGHHADDQAETVLFRALRGTGLTGLRGILPRRGASVRRPLLPFSRDELVAYALQAGLGWREDPTNRMPFARNVIRNEILPLAEARVAATGRASLARLARRAQANEAGWRSLLEELLDSVDLRREAGGFSVDRRALARRHPEVRARLVRELCRRLGCAPGGAGTRSAVEFTRAEEGRGGALDLGRGVVMARELDRVLVARPESVPADVDVRIPELGQGRDRGCIGGRSVRVVWWTAGAARPGVEAFAASDVRFPLVVRGRRAGDRVPMPYGTKKLKKLLLEARVPLRDRDRQPVLADYGGTVLWVPGVARSARAKARHGSTTLYVEIENAGEE